MTYRPNQWPVPVPRRERLVVDLIHWTLLICVVLLVAFLAACASPAPMVRVETVTVTKDVDRIVQVRCEDSRQPAPDYPDTPDKLAAIPEDDIFALAQARVAGTILRDARERENETQIKACTGE